MGASLPAAGRIVPGREDFLPSGVKPDASASATVGTPDGADAGTSSSAIHGIGSARRTMRGPSRRSHYALARRSTKSPETSVGEFHTFGRFYPGVVSRRRAFSVVTGICPNHGKIIVPFYPPPLSRNGRDELVIDLRERGFVEDFERRTSTEGACPICNAKLGFDEFGFDSQQRKEMILNQLVWSLLVRYPSLRGMSPDADPDEVTRLVRRLRTRIRVELDPGGGIRMSPWLDRIASAVDTADFHEED